jgi:hypothetical protein
MLTSVVCYRDTMCRIGSALLRLKIGIACVVPADRLVQGSPPRCSADHSDGVFHVLERALEKEMLNERRR